MSSCLVVDVGNTSTTLGVSRRGRIGSVQRLEGKAHTRASVDEALQRALGKHTVEGCALCSVVPASNVRWLRALKRATGTAPVLIHHKLNLGVKVRYARPQGIGADRLANASAAIEQFGAPAIVADFGTALTFDVISAAGEYIGGAIAPGLPVMTDYLAEKTALLPHIKLSGRPPAVGRSTVGAMRIGANVGYRGMVREIVTHLSEGLGDKKVSLCATGGYAKWALQGFDMPFVIEPNLTLSGVARIWSLN
ncbi:MAG: type III pantothenate kinase [Candidatus Promineifilaceae bacterium]